jgi:thioredoxin reductase (NADPH)
VRLCPICDGHEVIDRKVALYGPAARTVSHAEFMRTFTKNVSLVVPRGDEPAGQEELERLRRARIHLLESPLCEIVMTAERKAQVRLEDGSRHVFDTVYPALGSRIRSELAEALGARRSDEGDIVVDKRQQTSVPGLYAAGDVVAALNQLSVAVGHAAVAATAIHNSLGLE